MDPPHITEFASQRYFEKLRQLGESRDQPQDAVGQSHDGHAVAQSSTFILPIGQSKLPDQQIPQDHQKSEKRRPNFRLRSILTTRTSVEHEIRRSSIESPRKKRYEKGHSMKLLWANFTKHCARAVSRLINFSTAYQTSSRSKLLPPYHCQIY